MPFGVKVHTGKADFHLGRGRLPSGMEYYGWEGEGVKTQIPIEILKGHPISNWGLYQFISIVSLFFIATLPTFLSQDCAKISKILVTINKLTSAFQTHRVFAFVWKIIKAHVKWR
jgi:hypothetical protein